MTSRTAQRLGGELVAAARYDDALDVGRTRAWPVAGGSSGWCAAAGATELLFPAWEVEHTD